MYCTVEKQSVQKAVSAGMGDYEECTHNPTPHRQSVLRSYGERSAKEKVGGVMLIGYIQFC